MQINDPGSSDDTRNPRRICYYMRSVTQTTLANVLFAPPPPLPSGGTYRVSATGCFFTGTTSPLSTGPLEVRLCNAFSTQNVTDLVTTQGATLLGNNINPYLLLGTLNLYGSGDPTARGWWIFTPAPPAECRAINGGTWIIQFLDVTTNAIPSATNFTSTVGSWTVVVTVRAQGEDQFTN